MHTKVFFVYSVVMCMFCVHAPKEAGVRKAEAGSSDSATTTSVAIRVCTMILALYIHTCIQDTRVCVCENDAPATQIADKSQMLVTHFHTHTACSCC